jgi:hypothetical protein
MNSLLMPWQAVATLSLLLLATISSKIVKSHPRDLIFAIAALLTPLLGIVPSKQICQAIANPPMLAILCLWAVARAFRPKKFPLPLLLEIFSAYLFYFAIKNTALDSWIAPFLQNLPQWSVLTLLFLAAQALAFLMPRPVAFAILFSIGVPLLGAVTIALSLILNSVLWNQKSIGKALLHNWRSLLVNSQSETPKSE